MAGKTTPVDQAADLYCATWSAEPALIASAPGRVNLIGEHTDYNDGYVLPMAIDRRTAVAIGHGDAGSGIALASTLHPKPLRVDGPPLAPLDGGSWANYPLGVVAGFGERGMPVGPIRIAVASEVPTGAGLSSSAALETATAVAIAAWLRREMDGPALARLCQGAEHAFAGVRCGIMDQMASVLGGIVLLDCRTLETKRFDLPAEAAVVILDSGIPRGLGASEYNERRRQCEQGVELIRAAHEQGTTTVLTSAPRAAIRALRDVTPEHLAAAAPLLPDVVLRRCRHVVSEDMRVVEAVDALEGGDLKTLGRLFGESHASMRDDYEISLPEIDMLVAEAARTPGCWGARLTGAGFGGAVVALVEAGRADRIGLEIIERYRANTGKPGSALLVHADGGARVERDTRT